MWGYRKNASSYRLLSVLIALGVACLPCVAQVATGTLVGVITDASGSVIPDAQVRLKNTDTGVVKTQTTSTDGFYRFPLLPVGNYQLTVEAKGFEKLVQSDIRLAGEQVFRLDGQLRPGTVTTEVQVSAAAAKVDVQSMTLTTTVESRRVMDLPLEGRNVIALTQLAPGTVIFPSNTYTQTVEFPGVLVLPVNGTRPNMSNFTLDGADANDNYTNVSVPIPNPDVIEEVNTSTNGFSARYGKAGGAAVNFITKSGTNAFHGSAFEFLRHQDLNAYNTFSPKKDGLKRNQFGFAAGGPVVLPRIYNGKDRTFFIVSYQGTRLRSAPTANSAQVPTAAQRTGDFSGIAKQLVDPTTGTPFAGNQIPSDRLGTFAKNLFNYLPVPPAIPPLPTLPVGTLYYTLSTPANYNEVTAKIDQVKDKYHFSFRYFIDDYNAPANYTDNNLLTARSGARHRYQSSAINTTLTLTPRLLNQFIFSFDRMNTRGVNATGELSPQKLGMNIFSLPPPNGQIYFGASGYFGINTGGFVYSPRTNFQWADNFTYVRGRHEFMLGTNIQRVRMYRVNPFVASGYWTYDGSIAGNALGDLFLGRPNWFQQQNLAPGLDIRGTLWAFYGQDNFQGIYLPRQIAA